MLQLLLVYASIVPLPDRMRKSRSASCLLEPRVAAGCQCQVKPCLEGVRAGLLRERTGLPQGVGIGGKPGLVDCFPHRILLPFKSHRFDRPSLDTAPSCYAACNEKPRAMAVNAGQDFVIEMADGWVTRTCQHIGYAYQQSGMTGL
jgi:hypothetical protein